MALHSLPKTLYNHTKLHKPLQHTHTYTLPQIKLHNSSLPNNNKRISIMGIRLPSLNLSAKQILKRQFSFGSSSSGSHPDVPKGHIAVYVGDQEEKKRYVVPISYINHPSFKHLLNRAEEEFGFNHPMGGLTIPCRVESFVDLTSQLNA